MERLRVMTIEDAVRSALERCGLAREDAVLVAAVSGGPDSMALLHILLALSKELGFRLSAAHFNHRIRASAAGDARFVSNVCKRMGVECVVGAKDVPQYARENKLSLETAAREARYAFLNECARARGASCVALAHHLGDQVETLLMHILRGSSLSGLCAMRELSGGLFRPMLDISRADIEAYCFVNHVAYVLDETNTKTDIVRNRVRHELLPVLRRYNPAFDDAAMRLIEHARRDNDALDAMAKSAFSELSRRVPGGVALKCEPLSALPEALSGRVLLMAVESVLGSRKDYELTHVSGALALLGKASGAQMDLPHKLTAALGYGELLIIKAISYIFYFPFQAVTETPLGTFSLCGSESGASFCAPVGSIALGSACARTRRPGDWMRPKGLGGRKKVQDILVDNKIPRVYRDSLPLIAMDDEVLWIPGVCASEPPEDAVCIGFAPNEAWPLNTQLM